MTQSKWLKLFALVVVAAMSLTLLAGCSNGTAEPTTAPTQAPANGEGGDTPTAAKDPSEFTGSIMMWTGDDLWNETMEAAFSAVYPNVKLESTHLAWGDYLQKLSTSLASGLEVPDVINAEVGWRMRVFDMGILENLEAAPYNLDRNDMFEYLWPRCEDKNGNIVGIEMQITPAAIAFRNDLAKEFLNIEDKDTFIEQLRQGEGYEGYITVGKAFNEATGGEKTMFAGLGDAWEIVYRQNDTPLVNEDGSLNVSGNIEPCVEWMVKFMDNGLIGTIDEWTPQWEAAWALGDTLLFPAATWTLTSLEKDRDPDGAGHWTLAVPPGGAFSWGGTTMSIYSEGKNLDTTWEFIRWTGWDLAGAQAAKDRDYQLSRVSNYEADPSLLNKQDDYLGIDLFKFWGEECVDSAIAVVPTAYDQIVGDAVGVAFTAFQADRTMRTADLMEIIKTEIQNKEPTLELK